MAEKPIKEAKIVSYKENMKPMKIITIIKTMKKFEAMKPIIVMFTIILSVLISTSCSKAGKMKDNDFIKGADISSLQAVEDYGGKFYDFNGKEKDAITILKENGVNYLRLRIWNEPTLSFDTGDYCDLEHTIEMAKRIKKAGMKFLLDFHYSDWWADPSNQRIPKAWDGMEADEMAKALYDYTVEVLTALDKAGAYPDMIQIGNEIGNGMLWDLGRLTQSSDLALFLNSGIKAVRDTTPKNHLVNIMIHVQDGGSVDKTERFFTLITENGVTDYDIIGLSYYPYWHGNFADLKENINNLTDKFEKKVLVAETAYPFTNENADDTPNMIGTDETEEVGFAPSVENQKLVTELVMNAVADCEGGIGIFYWEPVWLSIKGAGAVRGGGNAWENQAMFDFEGKALESLKAFKITPGELKNVEALTVYKPEGMDINIESTKVELNEAMPKTVKVLYSDGSVVDTAVNWDTSSAPEVLNDFTSYTFEGEVLKFKTKILVNVIHENFLNNLGFEDGDTGWIIEKTTNAGIIRNDGDSYPKSGKWSFHYWDDKSFSINLYQSVVISETGDYTLAVWSQGAGGTDLLLNLYISDGDGNVIQSVDFRNAGWAEWQHPQLSKITLNEGQKVIIGIRVEGKFNDWGTLDDFSFYKGDPIENNDEENNNEEYKTPDDVEKDKVPIAEIDGNLIKNFSFEEGTTSWDVEKDSEAGIARNDGESTPKSGLWSFHYWNGSPFYINVSQKIAIETSGKYTLEVWNQGGESSNMQMELYIADAGGNVLTSIPLQNEGWANWKHAVLTGIELESGIDVTVGVKINGGEGDWGTIDDFALFIE